MKIRPVVASLICALLALSLAACGKTPEPPKAQTEPPATVEPAPAPAVASTSSVETSAPKVEPQAKTPEETSAEDGKHFGFIKRVTLKGDDVEVTVDYAEMLSGKEAADAAAAHGDESPPPNDYYIVNDNPKLRTFKLAKDASVRYLVGGEPTLHTVTGANFLGKWENANGDATILRNPYWLTVTGGAIVALEQQFLP